MALTFETTSCVHLYFGKSSIYSFVRISKNYSGMDKATKYVYAILIGCLILSVASGYKATTYRLYWFDDTKGYWTIFWSSKETRMFEAFLKSIHFVVIPIATLFLAASLIFLRKPKVENSTLKHINRCLKKLSVLAIIFIIFKVPILLLHLLEYFHPTLFMLASYLSSFTPSVNPIILNFFSKFDVWIILIKCECACHMQ